MKHGSLIHFAARVSSVISHPLTFFVVMVVMGLWILGWVVAGFPDSWRHMFGIVTSVITFTLLFILNTKQHRDRIVTHIKLDELIRASHGAHNAILDLDRLTEQDIEAIQSGYAEIATRAREALRSGRTADATAVVEIRSIPEWCDVAGALADRDRLAAIERVGLAGPSRAAGGARFDPLTRVAARQLGVPTVLLSIVTQEQQVFASATGLPAELEAARATPANESFCQYVVATGKTFVVNDSSRNPVVCDNPAVRTLKIAAYCGVPVRLTTGEVIGSLCAIDTHPRTWTQADELLLADLAEVVVTCLESPAGTGL